MANPMMNEEEVYRRIKEEGAALDPLIWELLDHHIRNDLQIILFHIEELKFTLQDVSKVEVKTVLDYYSSLTTLTAGIVKAHESILSHGRNISDLLTKLKDVSSKVSCP